VILVTGATGNVGRRVVERLVAAGRGVRAVSRDPDRAGLPAGVEAVLGRPARTVAQWARDHRADFS